jgi:hypothetical protein
LDFAPFSLRPINEFRMEDFNSIIINQLVAYCRCVVVFESLK